MAENGDSNDETAGKPGNDAESGAGNSSGAGKNRDFRALLISGMLAIVTTAAAQGIKAYIDGNLATSQFHFSLIEKALQSENAKERAEALGFLTDINLISDKAIVHGVKCYLSKHPDTIPQFLPANTTGGAPQSYVASFKDELTAAHPELAGKRIAVVGFEVRFGDIVNGFSPIYAELIDDPKDHQLMVGERHFPGDFHGESGGDEESVVKASRIVSEIDLDTGDYYGKNSVARMTVLWRRLANGGDSVDMTAPPYTETFGSGARIVSAVTAKQFRAPSGCYIADIRNVQSSSHSSGERYLNPEFKVAYRPFPGSAKDHKSVDCGEAIDAPEVAVAPADTGASAITPAHVETDCP